MDSSFNSSGYMPDGGFDRSGRVNNDTSNDGNRKRPAQSESAIPVGVVSSNSNIRLNTASTMMKKKARTGGTALAAPGMNGSTVSNASAIASFKRDGMGIGHDAESGQNASLDMIKARFLKMFEETEFQGSGIPNSALKDRFRTNFAELVPIINELISSSRIHMSRSAKGELIYTLVSADLSSKLAGLDAAAQMVYQVIQKAGDMGIWTKIIRTQTNIEQQTLNKIFKLLETRKLIKPVKSVAAKSKKLYMLYELVPAKELTGGVWYSDLEFDHEFISELRQFILQCVRRLNSGKGITTKQILEKMIQANVSKVELSVTEVQQILETLITDYLVEEIAPDDMGGDFDETTALYVAARRVTPMSEFKWWDSVLLPDFKYRTIKFEDGVTLSAEELHYQT